MANEMVDERSRRCAGAMLVVAVALLVIGLVMVGSASGSLTSSPWRTVFGRQAVFVLAGGLMMFVVARMGSKLLFTGEARNRWPVFLFAAVVVCLVVTFIPGVGASRHGSQRWLRVGPESLGLGFQPSEFAKLSMVVFLAWLSARESFDPRSLKRGFLPAALSVGVCVGLVGVEDFGTAALMGIVGGLTMFVAGCRIVHLAGAGAVGGCGLVGLLLAEPYRLERIRAFMDPLADPLGSGYHPIQSLMTIASGGWTGAGLGAGIQKRGYLPECATDFIFAVICEETGVLGGLLVIALFVVLVWLGLVAMWSAASHFERLLAFGVTTTIGLQAAMNIAVATVCVPTTGISLPLMSAGGSGVMMYCTAIGLVAAVALRGRHENNTGLVLQDNEHPAG